MRVAFLVHLAANRSVDEGNHHANGKRPMNDPTGEDGMPSDGVRRSNYRCQQVHIINRLWDPSGGSELRATSLWRLLSTRAPTTLWVSKHYDPEAAGSIPVRKLETLRGSFPRKGTFIIIGVYFDLGKWVYLARPSRVALVYNTPDPDMLSARIARYTRAFKKAPELVFASEKSRREAARPGIVLPSIIDLNRFRPSPLTSHDSFTVGRLSRAADIKHHPNDMAFYKRLVAKGCKVRVMGPTESMLENQDSSGGISLLPAMSVDAAQFLSGLDCFFYRTSPLWEEPWGRVVIEAMASGLPVVAHHRGGYAQVIEHGTNGFLFDSEEEALGIIDGLRLNPERRIQVGAAARMTAEAVLSREEHSRISDFYLGPSDD